MTVRTMLISAVSAFVGTLIGATIYANDPNWSIWTGWMKIWAGF